MGLLGVVPCRSPQYNSVRLGFTMIIALCFGAFYWGVSMRYVTQCHAG